MQLCPFKQTPFVVFRRLVCIRSEYGRRWATSRLVQSTINHCKAFLSQPGSHDRRFTADRIRACRRITVSVLSRARRSDLVRCEVSVDGSCADGKVFALFFSRRSALVDILGRIPASLASTSVLNSYTPPYLVAQRFIETERVKARPRTGRGNLFRRHPVRQRGRNSAQCLADRLRV
ncbi:hypothetical protein EVAR_102807_1 [Eumeta japonica]|uniref:Uncharacterized protein n=1 Tax=Eumeta variegata TaxID=151549 RepID=A0A4C1TKL2_EUMVA|nr:hypothetical protein EVAR_102807_1 [Eumeta japonica]